MRPVEELGRIHPRRAILRGACFVVLQVALGMNARAAETPEARFKFLHDNGNSSCTKTFLDSIPTLPKAARLQGSCCSEMELARYLKQTKALGAYHDIADIPPNPYDIEAGL